MVMLVRVLKDIYNRRRFARKIPFKFTKSKLLSKLLYGGLNG